MKTGEMWLVAQTNGKTYKCNGMRYSLNKGFYDPSNGYTWSTVSFSAYSDSDGRHGFDAFMNCDWEEDSLKIRQLKEFGEYVSYDFGKEYYTIKNGKLMFKDEDGNWQKSRIEYNHVVTMTFYEV